MTKGEGMKGRRIAGLGVLVAAIAASALLAAPVGAAKPQLTIQCLSGAPFATVATFTVPAGTASYSYSVVLGNGATGTGGQQVRPGKAAPGVVSNSTATPVTSVSIEAFSPSGASLGTGTCNFTT